MKSYQKPTWSSKPKIQWYLEEIKSGTILRTIDLPKDLEFVIVGKIKEFCTPDFVFEHESISRQHAIIQHRDNGRLYIYDLGSKNHTFWNKNEIKPLIYIPLRVGDILKFGESTRIYVVQSDDPKAIQLSEEQRVLQNNALKQKKKSKHDDQDEEDLEKENDSEDEESKKAFEGDDEELTARKRLRIEEEVHDNSLFDDQDEFYDRTLKNKKKEKQIIETSETLTRKREDISRKISELEARKKETEENILKIQVEDSEDALDQYMQNVKHNLIETGTSSIDEEIAKLKEKEKQLNILIEMSKPTIEGIKTDEEKRKEEKLDIIKNSMFVDRKPKNIHLLKEKKEPQLLDVIEDKLEEKKVEETYSFEDIEEEKPKPLKLPQEMYGLVQPNDLSNENEFLPVQVSNIEKNEIKNESEAVEEEKPQNEIKEKSKNKRKRKKKEEKKALNFYESVEENTAEWVAPKDQKGDGSTFLNEKFGY